MTDALAGVKIDNLEDVVDGNIALKWAAKSRGDGTTHRDVPLRGDGCDLGKGGNRLVNAFVQIGLAMALTGGDKAHHHVRIGSCSPFGTTRIGHQYGQPQARHPMHLSQHLCGISQLG